MRNRKPAVQRRPFSLRAIGAIRTPFTHSDGTPIRAAVSGGAEGTVELFPEFVAGLLDLEGFERVWLIYVMDRAVAAQLLTTPYLDREQHGIFATRAPARPNPIGLSAVRLLGIEGHRLLIAGVDMLDGTPLLNIKPYVPAFDIFPVSRIGWYSGKPLDGARADGRFERELS